MSPCSARVSARVVRWPCTEPGTPRTRTRAVPLAEPLALHPPEHARPNVLRLFISSSPGSPSVEVIPGFVRTTTRGPRCSQKLGRRNDYIPDLGRRVAAAPAAHAHRQGHHLISRLASATSCCVAETMITMSQDGSVPWTTHDKSNWLRSQRRLGEYRGTLITREFELGRATSEPERTGLEQPVPVRLLTQLPRAGTNAADRARTTRRVEKHDVEVLLVYRAVAH
jgi:hypothetical protein